MSHMPTNRRFSYVQAIDSEETNQRQGQDGRDNLLTTEELNKPKLKNQNEDKRDNVDKKEVVPSPHDYRQSPPNYHSTGTQTDNHKKNPTESREHITLTATATVLTVRDLMVGIIST